jgi:hypothetical protein
MRRRYNTQDAVSRKEQGKDNPEARKPRPRTPILASTFFGIDPLSESSSRANSQARFRTPTLTLWENESAREKRDLHKSGAEEQPRRDKIGLH